MKDKKLHLMIMRFNLIGAPHWYVTSDDRDHCRIQKKFNEFSDAWNYAKSIAYVKNITTYEK